VVVVRRCDVCRDDDDDDDDDDVGGATRAEGDAAPTRAPAPRAIACIRSNTRRHPGRNMRARGRGSQTTAAKEFGARLAKS